MDIKSICVLQHLDFKPTNLSTTRSSISCSPLATTALMLLLSTLLLLLFLKMLFWQFCFIPSTPLVWMSVWGSELGLLEPLDPSWLELEELGLDSEAPWTGLEGLEEGCCWNIWVGGRSNLFLILHWSSSTCIEIRALDLVSSSKLFSRQVFSWESCLK